MLLSSRGLQGGIKFRGEKRVKNQNEVVHMKKNCALHFLIASLLAILLNLNNLLTGEGLYISVAATTATFALWGCSLFCLFQNSTHPGKACIRLFLVLLLFTLLFELNMWIFDQHRMQCNSVIEKICLSVYLIQAIPFCGLKAFGLDGMEMVLAGYGATGLLLGGTYLWARSRR